MFSFLSLLSVDCTDRLMRSKGISYLLLIDHELYLFAPHLEGFSHAPHRVGREPPLDQPYERLTHPGQWVGRTGKRQYLVIVSAA